MQFFIHVNNFSFVSKVYENIEGFKLNDVVEFIGILSNDPAMVTFPEQGYNKPKIIFFFRLS